MIYLVGADYLGFTKSTVEECLEYFKDKPYVQFDTETERNSNPDLLPNPHSENIICIQVGDRDNQWVISASVDYSALKTLVEDPNKVKLFTNAFFDLRFMHHWKWKPVNIYDCFLVERLLTLGKEMPKGYLGLAGMAERYCGVTLKKEIRGQIHWRGLDSDVIQYAAQDVMYMEDIMHSQLERVKADNLENVVRLENKHIISLAKISYKGIGIDPEKWKAHYEQNLILLEEYEKKLNEYVVNYGDIRFIQRQLSLFDTSLTSNINWNSSSQVVRFFKVLGIDCLVRDKDTGEMKDSVDGKHLQRQIKKFPILPIYLKYKEIDKEISTYGLKWIKENVNPVSGRVHSEFFPILDTGRISSSKPKVNWATAWRHAFKNSVNSGKIRLKGNPEPSYTKYIL